MRRFLSHLGGFLETVERISNVCSGWLIISVMLLVILDVSLRFFLNESIPGAYNLAEIIMVAICFLPMAFAQRENAHISVDFVLLRLKGRSKEALETTSFTLSFLIASILFYRSVVEASVAVDLRLTTSGIVKWPAWPLKILVAVAFFFISLRLFIQVVQKIKSLVVQLPPAEHAAVEAGSSARQE